MVFSKEDKNPYQRQQPLSQPSLILSFASGGATSGLGGLAFCYNPSLERPEDTRVPDDGRYG